MLRISQKFDFRIHEVSHTGRMRQSILFPINISVNKMHSCFINNSDVMGWYVMIALLML